MISRASICAAALLAVFRPAGAASQNVLTTPALEPWGYLSVSYAAGLPRGDTRDFLDESSFRGAGADAGMYLGRAGLHIGLSWQWNLFHGSTRTYVSLPGFDASGDQSRRLHISPLLAEIGYDWTVQTGPLALQPFLRMGVGAYYVSKEIDFGVTRFEKNWWRGGFSPCAGVHIPLYRRFRGAASLRYHHVLDSDDDTGHAYFSVKVGLTYVL